MGGDYREVLPQPLHFLRVPENRWNKPSGLQASDIAGRSSGSGAARPGNLWTSSTVVRHLISGFLPSVPVPEQGASTRIRSNLASERKRLAVASRHYSAGFGGHIFKPAKRPVACDDRGPGLEHLGGLVAGRGAQVQCGHSRLDLKIRHDRLRADVLLASCVRD